MDNPSEDFEWRAVVLKSGSIAIPKRSSCGEDDDVIDFDLSEYYLKARTSAIDTVRQYYNHSMMKRSSVMSSKSSLTQTSRPSYHSFSSSNSSNDVEKDVASVVFPILTGTIGSGTSQLIEYALKRQVVDEQCGYYVHAKFDMRQHADPHRSFIVAWSAFAEEVVRRGPETMIAMRDTILSACQSEISSLLEVIPALRAILEYGDKTTSPEDATLESNHRRISERRQSVSLTPPTGNSSSLQRFLFAFQTFLKAIAHSDRPIILVLDCLQWADPCAIDFVCSILQDIKDIPGFFLIGTHEDGTLDLLRDDEAVDQASYLVRKLQEVIQRSNHVVAVKTILIGDLDFIQVKQMLNQTLQQSSLFDLQIEDDICQLVYQHAHGNLTYTTEFLGWLYRTGLLRKDRPRNAGTSFAHWTWNIDAMHREVVLRLKDDDSGRTPFYVADRLNELPAKVIELLKVCACLGYLHTEDTILEYVLECPVRSLLSEAVKLGVLDSLGSGPDAFAGTMYCFKHDILQMAVYDLVAEKSQELFHLEIGRRLWRRLSPDELDQSIFVVLSQLILGRRLISRPNERYRIVTLCLHAGRKAATLSNFGAASTYLKFGIELLGDLGWKEVYDVALAIHNDACEMEMCAANFEEMSGLVESILRHARCDGDKLQARTTQIYALSVSDRQLEALDLGIQLLTDIGSPLPKTLNVWMLLRNLRSVQNLLKGKSNHYLKGMPLIEDEDILAAMRILHLIFLPAILLRPKLAPFIALKLMKLTMKHGLCFMSPLAFAGYGMLCIGLSDTNAAFRFGDLGMELLDLLHVREYIPRVYALYYSCIYAWKYPIRGALDPLLHAHRVGMHTGDIEFSCLCANLWCFMSVDAGCSPLDEIEKLWLVLQRTMKSQRQTSLIRLSLPWLQTIAYFQGRNVDFSETEALLKDSVAGERNLYANDIYWCQAKTAYLFNDLERADELSYIANFWKVRNASAPTPENVYMAFMNGMIAFSMAMDHRSCARVVSPRRSRRQYIHEGRNMIRFIKKYALWCPANFSDMKFLLQAELASVNMQSQKAMELYTCAIAFAKDSQNLFIQALANERAGRYCLGTLRQTREAVLFLNEALSAYKKWTALRKVDHLNAELIALFGAEEHEKLFAVNFSERSTKL